MKATPSRTSPKSGERGCLCKDGKTYNKKCCDGTIWAQGMGSLIGGNNSTKTQNIETRVKP